MGSAGGTDHRSHSGNGRIPCLGPCCRLHRRLRRDQEAPQGLGRGDGSRRGFLITCKSTAVYADASFAGSVTPVDLAVISSPFLFISNLCFRSRPLTNPRDALATAPGRLDASTITVDSTTASLRS